MEDVEGLNNAANYTVEEGTNQKKKGLGNPAGSKTAQIGEQGGVQLWNSGGGQSGRDGKDGDW